MQHHTQADQFPTDATGLPESRAPELVELSDGDHFDLRIAPVAKRLGDATVRMLAYNGSIPGPTLKVQEGSEVVVDVENQGDMDATVHWHGLRLENRYDGTHETQQPMAVGERFSARVAFPDPGLYWYHPHIREDYGQELGLYGNVLVEPADPDYWPPAHREVVLTLDDILLEDGKVAPFSRTETTYAAMGRFGDVLLISGEPDLSLTARRGEVVRLYLTNTANTRVFKVKLPGARDEAGRRRQRPRRARAVRRRRGAGAVGASHRRRPVRRRPGSSCWSTTRRIGSTPLAAITVSDGAGRTATGGAVRGPAHQPRHGGRARAHRAVSGGRAATRPLRSSPRWTWMPRWETGRSSTPARCTRRWSAKQPGHCPQCGNEAPRGRGAGDHLHVPDAPAGRQRGARPLPGLRHEAAAGAPRRRGRRPRA